MTGDGTLRVGLVASNNARCGISMYLHDLAGALRRAGVDAEAAQFDHDVVSALPPVQPLYFYRFGRRLRRYDVVHIQHEYGLFGPHRILQDVNLAALLRGLGSVPAVITYHTVAEELLGHMRPSAASLRRRIYRRFYARWIRDRCCTAVVHTEVAAATLAVFAGVTPTVIRHGVPLQPMPAPAEREQAKASLGLGGKFVVTLFGFLAPYKGALVAIPAMARLDNAVLVIAGGLHPKDAHGPRFLLELKRAIARTPGVDVRITGWLSDDRLAAYERASDVVIAPYLTDQPSASGAVGRSLGFGNVLVCTDVAAFVELAGLGGRIVFTRRHAVGAPGHRLLAQRLRELQRQRDGLEEIRRANHELAQRLSWDSAAAQHIEAYWRAVAPGVPAEETPLTVPQPEQGFGP
jgi:polysaccharide biosynthesis protein PslF